MILARDVMIVGGPEVALRVFFALVVSPPMNPSDAVQALLENVPWTRNNVFVLPHPQAVF